MSRYLERAAHVCRLVSSQFQALEDSQVDEIDANWRRIFNSLGRQPAVGGLASSGGDEEYMLVDSYTLADELIFDCNNPDSLHSCIGYARENARQVRNALNKEFWSCLNTTYLDIADNGIEKIWNNQPREFFRKTKDVLQTVSGITDSTTYRNHGWHFMQLGRFVERAQLITSLLNAQIAQFPTKNMNAESYWISLLSICEARVAYSQMYSMAYDPPSVVDFLVSDPRLSHSIRYSMQRVTNALGKVSAEHSNASTNTANEGAYRLMHHIDHEWSQRSSGDEATGNALNEIANSSRELHNNIVTAYFAYDVESSLSA